MQAPATKRMQMKQNKNGLGIFSIVLALIAFTAIFIFGMEKLGVTNISEAFGGIFTEEAIPHHNAPAANISNKPSDTEYFEAIPREEYASALAKMYFPDEYYRNYRIAISSAENMYVTEYFAVKNHDDWWVQTANDGVILQTAICSGDSITLTDNASNTSVNAYDISFEEKCGVLSLKTLVDMIYAVANGDEVIYGGGIADYSLSFTQTRLSGENLFSFSFVCQNGVSEEYTFSFENSVILSASKSYEGKEIYKMEIKDYRNTLDEINIDSLFSAN